MKAIHHESVICGGNFRNHGRPGEKLFESRQAFLYPPPVHSPMEGAHCVLQGRLLESQGPEE